MLVRGESQCDCGVPSGANLFAYRISSKNKMKIWKITPDAPKIESGIIQIMRMGKSIRQKWVNTSCNIQCTAIATGVKFQFPD